MKSCGTQPLGRGALVALFTRAWIEISYISGKFASQSVALFTRAWIEISYISGKFASQSVALFTRAWIEINCHEKLSSYHAMSPSLRGRGLKYRSLGLRLVQAVALFTRAWIEITAEIYRVNIDTVALFTRAWIEIANLKKI